MKKLFRKIAVFSILGSLAILPVSAENAEYKDYTSEISGLEQEQQELQAELAGLQAEFSEIADLKTKDAYYAQSYDEQIALKEQELRNIRMQMNILQQQIETSEQVVQQKQQEVDEGIERFKQRLRFMYMTDGYDVAAVLSGSESFYDIYVLSELMERLSVYDKLQIDSLKKDINVLDANKIVCEQAAAELSDREPLLKQDIEELRNLYSEHDEIQEFYQAKLDAVQNMTAEARAREDEVEEELSRTIRLQQRENERKRKDELERRRKEEKERREREKREKAKQEQSVTYVYMYYTGNSDLIWPCPTVWNITDGYGYRSIAEEGGAVSFHKGIDINKPNCYGEPIVAAQSGWVLRASNTGNGYGIHVVLDHGDSLSTLYGHMSSCCVNVGDYVEQGQVIGYIGATGYAYGNHCHFEVRINGTATDPLDFVEY